VVQGFAAALALTSGPTTSRNSGRWDGGISLSEIVGARPSNNCGCAERMPAQRARTGRIADFQHIATIGSGCAASTRSETN
jgi:hypothetical protein